MVIIWKQHCRGVLLLRNGRRRMRLDIQRCYLDGTTTTGRCTIEKCTELFSNEKQFFFFTILCDGRSVFKTLAVYIYIIQLYIFILFPVYIITFIYTCTYIIYTLKR